jgi:hypothetical protein
MKSDVKRMLDALSTAMDGAVDDLQYVLRSDSRAVGKNLEASDENRFPGQAAHYIVAANHVRAAQARMILKM